MSPDTPPEKPVWLEEQPGIAAILHKVVDRLDKNTHSRLGFTLNPKTLPALFEQSETADLIWSLLQTLFESNPAIFSFHENKKSKPYDPVYTNARIRFNPAAQTTLRQWLNRPLRASELEVWRDSVEKNRKAFTGSIQRLSASKITVQGKTPEDIINGFIKIKPYIQCKAQAKNLTLRNLSARCFWQDSKFLDNREELLAQLYPQLQIATRPVIVNAMLPEKILGVLFIENQDNYTQGITGSPDALQQLALIYTAGFKLSAKRIRADEEASFHYHGNAGKHQVNQLTDWWYDRCQQNWPVYFWGDLDFSGMDILKKLKQRFAKVEAWQPGYQPMLELLLSGGGHTPEATSKQEQKDTGNTGCTYADTQLLPALREMQRFVDQEWVYQ
ncbi:hypothetical protein MNBD_GAMMA10-2230 [hydrothermal vent metagenome]|uniref:Wadjet protein JetD C-terminal domain-containing protein n=1 Tax=hydrothermal vent metagenome TaxID=652676 RepID=A0A3B0YU84_9ZZZZ